MDARYAMKMESVSNARKIISFIKVDALAQNNNLMIRSVVKVMM
jgi:hypothetical protein